MLSSLKDPYTRFLTPDQYDTLASVARGGSAGIGVQLQVRNSKIDWLVYVCLAYYVFAQ
jgi:C-terminal processing protease CtpA/Prc